MSGFSHDALVFLAATVVVTPLSRVLDVSPILGYLVAGCALGAALQPVLRAPFGGVEFLENLVGARPELVAIARPDEALVIGAALSLSSSALALRLLQEKKQSDEKFALACLGVLLLQDVAVVPLLVLLPIIEDTQVLGFDADLWSPPRASPTGALLGALLGGRVVLRRVFAAVAGARSSETFVALCLLVVLGTGALTDARPVADARAFVAGVLLAETNYRDRIEADIQPFRGLLLGLFFVTTGAPPTPRSADATTLAAAPDRLPGPRRVVAIRGFGPEGMTVAAVLAEAAADLGVVAFDESAPTVAEARWLPVAYGALTPTLVASVLAGDEALDAVLVPAASAAEVERLRKQFPDAAPRPAASYDAETPPLEALAAAEVARHGLSDAGADVVVGCEVEPQLRLAAAFLAVADDRVRGGFDLDADAAAASSRARSARPATLYPTPAATTARGISLIKLASTLTPTPPRHPLEWMIA
ncbi:solute:proton antiporter [Aureococcus anophagefferens]|nr:solute:proton antiporter [Aureococcus anophagefferens]